MNGILEGWPGYGHLTPDRQIALVLADDNAKLFNSKSCKISLVIEMTELKLKIPEELEKEIKELPEDWSKVALKAIEMRAFELELERSKEIRHALLRLLASKSKMTEKDALELGRILKKGRFEQLRKKGLV